MPGSVEPAATDGLLGTLAHIGPVGGRPAAPPTPSRLGPFGGPPGGRSPLAGGSQQVGRRGLPSLTPPPPSGLCDAPTGGSPARWMPPPCGLPRPLVVTPPAAASLFWVAHEEQRRPAAAIPHPPSVPAVPLARPAVVVERSPGLPQAQRSTVTRRPKLPHHRPGRPPPGARPPPLWVPPPPEASGSTSLRAASPTAVRDLRVVFAEAPAPIVVPLGADLPPYIGPSGEASSALSSAPSAPTVPRSSASSTAWRRASLSASASSSESSLSTAGGTPPPPPRSPEAAVSPTGWPGIEPWMDLRPEDFRLSTVEAVAAPWSAASDDLRPEDFQWSPSSTDSRVPAAAGRRGERRWTNGSLSPATAPSATSYEPWAGDARADDVRLLPSRWRPPPRRVAPGAAPGTDAHAWPSSPADRPVREPSAEAARDWAVEWRHQNEPSPAVDDCRLAAVYPTDTPTPATGVRPGWHVLAEPAAPAQLRFSERGSLPIACPVPGCAFRTARRSQLTRHNNRVHLRLKPHPCKPCNRWFASRSDRKKHFEIHHGRMEG